MDGNPAVNIARGKTLTSASGVTITNPLYATDGNKANSNYATISSGLKYAQLDLTSSQNIEKIKLWHYYSSTSARKYYDVIIQLSNDPTFATGVTTVFNNDKDNTAGFGAGPDDEYDESAEGKEFIFNPVYARYVRIWSNGNTANSGNHIVELEVYPSTLPMTYYYDAWGNQKDFNEVNGDFETDSDTNGKDDNWSFANIAITSLSATTVKFGKKSQKIGTTTIASDASVYKKDYKTEPGHKYLLTGYCYVVSKANKLSTRVNNLGTSWNTNLGNTYWPDTLNQWYQTGVVFTATSDATTIIPCFIDKQLCEVYLDGWKLIDLTVMYGAGNEPLTLTDAIKAVNNSITYAGYQYDKETGLYYLNARFYDASTARFLQEDTYSGSIDDPLSLNLYSYVSNNPISYYDPTGHFLSEIVGAAKGAYNAGKRVVGTTIEGAKAIYRNPSVIIESADTIINRPEEAAQMVNEELVKPVVTKDLGIKKGSKPYKVLKYVGVRAEATAITGVNLGKGIVKGVGLAGETIATDMAFSAVEVGRVFGIAGLDNDLTYENAHNEMYGKVNALANQWMAVPGAIYGDIKTAGNLNNLGNFLFNPDLSLHEAVEYEQSVLNTALIVVPAAKLIDAGLKAGVAGIRNSATALVDRSGLQPSTVGGYGTNISGWSGLRSALGDSAGPLAGGLGSNVLYSVGNTPSTGFGGKTGNLNYVHKIKANKITDIDDLNAQIQGQVDAMNNIIQNEGLQGLKNRIRSYNKKIEAEGRAYVKSLDPAPDGFAWLHEPDMKTGGLPTDVTRIGNKRTNSIIGGQANRIANDILNMSDDVTEINWTLELK